jgi:hypothetical protein
VREQAVFHTGEEHHRELQALGGVQRHHLHAVFPGIGLALAGFQHRMREEGIERRHRLTVDILRLEAARGGDELEQVLDLRLAAFCLVLLIVLEEAAGIEHVVDGLVQRQIAGFRGQPLDQLHGSPARRPRPSGPAHPGNTRGGRLPERTARALGLFAQHVEAARADAARWQVHDALERGVVVAVRNQAQVGERILDLGALEEPQATIDAIGMRADRRFFEHARLGVRAVQDRDVACARRRAAPIRGCAA